ncbi:MAG TPA: PKD domain-containing protein, partial [Chitinophagales bacterium]|nr:PKD domain-containing protein [Chitinophagales bacterium]
NYNITLRVTNSQGCTDTAMHSITVANPPLVNFSNSPPCTSTAVNFTDNSSNIVDTWQWQFGDNDSAAVQNPAHVYAAPGNYTVSLTATDTNNCRSTISQAIVVSAPPVAAFTAPAACEENTSVFTDASTGNPVQWQWNFGDGNTSSVQHPAHVYSSDGNYTAMLIATNGFQCADTITQQVTVHPKPTAAFSTVNVCYPNPVTFSNSSTGAIVNNGWSFGDMLVSTQQNPTHTYAAAGGYNATLLVVTSDGCADTLTQTLMVYHKPVAAFIVPDVCQGGTSVFTNTSSIGSGSIASYEWTFGDGSPADAQEHTTHAYTAPNTYSATLIVTSDNNCGDTITQPAMVNPNPTAAFTTANVCYGNAATFTNMSTGSIAANDWSFGDNQNSSVQNPTHDYASAGSYFTQLIVTTGAGCADTTIRPIIVNPKPDAHFSIPAVCLGLSSLFTENSTGNIVSYNWNFADGNTSTQQNPYNLYAADGNYEVQLIVTSDSACLDTFTMNAVVHPLPVPGFTTPAVCLNQTMSFTNTSTINSGSINQWWWDLGDGNTGTAHTPTYTYTAQGTYNVRLIATSDNNCVDSTMQSVTVYDKPVAAFTATEVCETQATVFADASAIGNGTLAQWQYDFGDAQVSSQPSAQNIYTTHGTYTATLIVTSTDGCTDTATQVITVNPLPVLSFSAPDVCLGIASQFSNTSSIPTGTISTYTWALGDGNTTTSVSPANTYAAFGTYTVSLTAESDKGCMQTTTQTVQVFDIPVASATSTPACYQLDNGTATALATDGTPPYNYRWNTGGVTATVTALFADNYAVTITDANSCTTTAATVVSQPTGPLTIASNPLNPVIKLNDIVAVNLSNSYGDLAATYIVSPDYGLTCATCSQFDAQPYQTTEYTVTVTDTQGCTGTSQFTIMVDQALPLFIPNVFTPNSDGANDTWGVYSQAVKQLRLFIFNRWGEKVFEGDGINQTWDGTYQGKPVPAGIYTYWGDIVYLNNNTMPVKGTVTLIR